MTSPVEPWGRVGDRSGLMRSQQNLRGNLTATPTGRNLLAGTDVRFKYPSDPTNEPPSNPDGTHGYYVDGVNLVEVLYDRETGWTKVTLTP